MMLNLEINTPLNLPLLGETFDYSREGMKSPFEGEKKRSFLGG